MPKKILIGIIIILILFIFSTCSHATEPTEVEDVNSNNFDVYNYSVLRMQNAMYRLMRAQVLYYKQNNSTLDPNFRSWCRNLSLRTSYGFVALGDDMTYFLNQDNTPIETDRAYILYGFASNFNSYTMHNSDVTWSIGNSTIYYKEYTHANLVASSFVDNRTGVVSAKTYSNAKMGVPVGVENQFTGDQWDFINYVADNNSIDLTNESQVISQINSKISETNSKLQNIQNNANETNQFLKDDTVSDYSSSDLPSDSMNDITSDGFNNIFNTIRNSFTSDTSQTVDFSIPYLDYTFSVNSFYIRNSLINAGFQSIVDLFTLIWYSSISLFIVKDIYKYINQIKNGDIGHTDTNIKADML